MGRAYFLNHAHNKKAGTMSIGAAIHRLQIVEQMIRNGASRKLCVQELEAIANALDPEEEFHGKFTYPDTRTGIERPDLSIVTQWKAIHDMPMRPLD